MKRDDLCLLDSTLNHATCTTSTLSGGVNNSLVAPSVQFEVSHPNHNTKTSPKFQPQPLDSIRTVGSTLKCGDNQNILLHCVPLCSLCAVDPTKSLRTQPGCSQTVRNKTNMLHACRINTLTLPGF